MQKQRSLVSFSLFRLAAFSLVHTGSGFTTCPQQSIFASSISSSSSSSSSSSRAYSSTTPSRASTMSSSDILEPQGKHYGWYSIQPLVEASKWGSSPGAYFKEMSEANGGAPIFKCHPGLASVALLDYASGEWFFNQPDSVLDRQDGAYFGPLKCTSEYLGTSLPALVTNLSEVHPSVREYTISALRERVGEAEGALSHALDNFYKDLWSNGLGEYTTVYDTMLKSTSAFMLEWVLGAGEEGGQPAPPFKDFINVNPSDHGVLIQVEVDTPVANALMKVTQALTGGVSKGQKASIEVLLDSIRSSKMWPKYVQMVEGTKMPLEDLERSFMFNTGFQSSVAIANNMEFATGCLSACPEFLKELRKELDGKELTLKTVKDLESFPLLDSFHWEILRMFPAPPFFFKKAKVDAVVPTNSGQRYQIKKGDMVYCHQPLVQTDEAKFGPDAREFKPKRFVGNPGLKKDVFAFAFADSTKVESVEGKSWGCAGYAIGIVDSLLKVMYGRWVQEADWEMVEPSIIDPIDFLGTVGPKGMAFKTITPRK